MFLSSQKTKRFRNPQKQHVQGLHRLIHGRDLVWVLVVQKLKMRYRRSFLGALWAVLNPLAFMLAFNLLGAFLKFDIPNYPLFILTGIVPWNWFQDGLLTSAVAITGHSAFVKQPGVPPAVLVLTDVIITMADFLVAMPLLFAFLIYNDIYPTWTSLLLPLIVVPQFLLILGLGLIVAALNVSFRDVRHLLDVGLRLLFFLTPVFYDPGEMISGKFQLLYQLNPMVHLCHAYRSVLIEGVAPDAATVLLLWAASLATLVVGYALFSRASHRFATEL